LSEQQGSELVEEILREKGSGLFFSSSLRFVDAIGSAGPAQVRYLLDTIKKDTTSQEEALACLACLGRLGRLGVSAVPSLREKLKDPRTTPSVAAVVRVALANMGDDSNENKLAILELVRAGQNENEVLVMLIKSRSKDWVSPEMIQELNKRLELPKRAPVSYDSLIAPCTALALIGKSSESVSLKLAALQEKAINEKHPFCVVASLALARINPSKATTTLRRLFKEYSMLQDLSRGKLAILVENPYVMIDSQMSLQLARMLEDSDTDVSKASSAG
jgi:hypothetical protein